MTTPSCRFIKEASGFVIPYWKKELGNTDSKWQNEDVLSVDSFPAYF